MNFHLRYLSAVLLPLSFPSPSMWYICLISAQNSHTVHTPYPTHQKILFFVMAALHSRCGRYIFALWFLSFCLSFYLFSSPNLSGRRLDVYHTSTHVIQPPGCHNPINVICYVMCVLWCGPSANLECMSEMCCTWLAEIQDAKMWQKIPIWAPSHNFVGLYFRN